MENPSEPISDATYFDCLEGIIEKSKVSGSLDRNWVTSVSTDLVSGLA